MSAAYKHERAFASVHNRLPYVPWVDRKPIQWPGGARVAVWVVPNVEHYEYLPPAGPIDPYPRTPHPDVRKHSYHDYGNRVGFWRLLSITDRYDIPCTVSLNLAHLDHYPEIAAAMVERNWEFMSHGLYNTRFLDGMSFAQQIEFIAACNAVVDRHRGRRLRGMLGPHISATAETPDAMAAAGMSYHADWVHDERPSPLLNASGRPLVALPYSYELNDAPILMRSSAEGPEYLNRCQTHFDRLYTDTTRDSAGRLMCLPLHPFAIGQPHRIRYLARLLDHIRRHEGVWIATASDIVDYYLDNYYDLDLKQALETAESMREMNVTSADGRIPARPGSDHRWFRWSSIEDRPTVELPNGTTIAVAVIVDMGAVEWESLEPSEVPPPGGRGLANYPDFPRMSHREFGHRVGVFRLFDMLDRSEIRSAVSVDVLTAEEYPGLLPHLKQRTAEFLCRGLSASRPVTSSMTLDEERHYIASSLDRLEAALEFRPVGWMGPEHSESARTPGLLAEAGLRYVADWVNDEQPYLMDGAGSGLWALPVSWELCDVNVLQIRDVSPEQYGKALIEAFDVLSSEGRRAPRMLTLHLHPWLSGQPLAAGAIESALEHIVESGEAWIATPAEIVNWWAKHG